MQSHFERTGELIEGTTVRWIGESWLHPAGSDAPPETEGVVVRNQTSVPAGYARIEWRTKRTCIESCRVANLAEVPQDMD